MSEIRLTPNDIFTRVRAVTETARASGALRCIDTSWVVVSDGGVDFVVRVAENLARKDAETRAIVAAQAPQAPAEPRNAVPFANRSDPPPQDPFLPWEPELYVGHLGPEHVCILNRFPVIRHHFLLVTRTFVPQVTPLTRADIQASCTALAAVDGLAFYNGGALAGASLPHKHIQVAPLPLVEGVDGIPIEAALDRLPFEHALVRFEPTPAGPLSADVVYQHYVNALTSIGLRAPTSATDTHTPGAYNLLLTRRWLLVVPRSAEHVGGMSFNALGFAGTLFARHGDQVDQIRALGPMRLLEDAVSGKKI